MRRTTGKMFYKFWFLSEAAQKKAVKYFIKNAEFDFIEEGMTKEEKKEAYKEAYQILHDELTEDLYDEEGNFVGTLHSDDLG